MNVGSEKFAWKLYPGIPHVCSVCSCELRVVDVRRDHSTFDYSSGRGVAFTGFRCAEHVHEDYA